MTTDMGTVSAVGSQGDVYGLLRLGGLDVALPLSALREVVPRPAELPPLPVVAPGLVGTMRLRSLVLPVVDLRPLLERTDEEPDQQVVVVVAHAGRVVGLIADEVRGVARVDDDELQTFVAAGARLLVSHAFQHGPGASPVSVLDAEVLLTLPGVPTVAEVTPVGQVAVTPIAGARTTEGSSGLTLVRCGPHMLAVAVDDIHTTIPLGTVAPSVLTGGDCLGVTRHAGLEVAVVDPLALLGLAPLDPSEIGAGIVVQLGPGLVVLAVSELVELRGAGAVVLPLPAYGAGRPELLRGMVELDSGACLVIDGAALRSNRGLLALASVNTTAGAAVADVEPGDGTDPTRSTTGAPAYFRYTAGIDLATPLSQVSEVLPLPETLTPAAADRVLGLFVHRGTVVPMISLSEVLGLPAQAGSASACVLLVEADGEQVAFAVDALRGIEPLTWTDPERVVKPLEDLSRAVRDAALVRLGGAERFVPALDLEAVARATRLDTRAEAIAAA